MDNLLQGMPYVVAYLDDILFSEQEHLDNLECVLKTLSEAGMRLKREKCLFMLPEVDYGGTSNLKRRNSPAPAPLHSWEYPTNPWSRIHVDHAGPVLGHTLLIVMDAYSKWIDAMPVNSTSSAETIEKLRHLFSNFGVPDKVVSDN
ncbi:uncharacterized protein K02A2.6-like, partial [Gigantopelta aegis]|uniref:uncharacterized protein K02A2.6-like n=1 Tax=Gigantopelta aegis TaxID=1735272 RepID=UPI001B88CA02